MDAVILHGAGHAIDAFQHEGQQWDVIDLRFFYVDGVEFRDVVAAIIRGKGDAAEDDFGMRILHCRNNRGQVHFRIPDGQPTQAIVTAEGDDDDGWMKLKDFRNAKDTIFRGVAADAEVDDAITISKGIQVTLQIGRIAFVTGHAVASG